MVEGLVEILDRHGMLPEGGAPLVLMVSGGSDSTALCLFALELVETGRLLRESIHVLHVDHGLRGEDSDNDALFVERLAGLCRFDFRCVSIDIAAHEGDFGRNMESTARHLRYAEAFRLVEEASSGQESPTLSELPGQARIWTAHTRDDRIETFYMRSIVGTGPGGFAAIAARNGIIARPFLSCGRQELRDFIARTVAQRGWELDPPARAQVPGGLWREDHTNYEPEGFRAFVRNELIPVAERRNPSLGMTLSRSMDLIAEESAFVDALVDEAACGALRAEGIAPLHPLEAGFGAEPVHSLVALDLEKAGGDGGLHPVLMRRLVHRLAKQVLAPDERIEGIHIEHIASHALEAGFAADLPGGARVERQGPELVFLSKGEMARREAEETESAARRGMSALLPVPGIARIEGEERIVSAAVIEADPLRANAAYARGHAGDDRAFLDFGKLVSAQNGAACETGISNGDASALLCLEVSYWREGDVMCPLGMNGAHKKLSDLFTDKKVDRGARGKAIVVRAGDKIAWVAGVAVDDRFKVEGSGRMVLIETGESDVMG